MLSLSESIMKNIFLLFLIFANQILLAETNRNPRINGNENVIYISPLNNSKFHHITTNIIIRTKIKLDKSTLMSNIMNVTGSVSGLHTGKLNISDDDRTILFNPDLPFNWGETVFVNL